MAAAEAEARVAKLRADAAASQARAEAAQALADSRASAKPGFLTKIAESAARGAANQAARSFMRGVLGSIFGGRR